MFKLIIYGLAAYAVYILFFQKKKPTIRNKSTTPGNASDFAEYEEIK
ncbi:MAG: hypothetical protein IPP06_02000 [Saprospiraceae bacterium]|nr:hypothetical protein [Candidatus Vicinibacter affinis]MBP6173090.1 hypothetical protein [Saprospiraceae bacterium]MBK6573284.1 hypothetical protein [Candidatus Vicinibacter affinis]MBK6822243.1 hypothetical protein [Candidatus Vicinibacter affinis]MBK7301967.1 hypothetical protein [Candidatus Vicinibacter affinis]